MSALSSLKRRIRALGKLRSEVSQSYNRRLFKISPIYGNWRFLLGEINRFTSISAAFLGLNAPAQKTAGIESIKILEEVVIMKKENTEIRLFLESVKGVEDFKSLVRVGLSRLFLY